MYKGGVTRMWRHKESISLLCSCDNIREAFYHDVHAPKIRGYCGVVVRWNCGNFNGLYLHGGARVTS